jgi:thiamine-monophosphate kinase
MPEIDSVATTHYTAPTDTLHHFADRPCAMLSEFELISRFFTRPAHSAILGIGDDCALLAASAGTQLAISTDMLVSGIHFFADTPPEPLGHKSLAVNLSDLAAMGAAPRAFTLALSLPSPSADWLTSFSAGLFALADRHHCELIGGDTTRGPLNICITVFGEVPANKALRRDQAQAGDDIWVSGTLGDARLALEALQGKILIAPDTLAPALARLYTPTPRVALGIALRDIAHSAIDLSDGLKGDITHIMNRSQLGACIMMDELPPGTLLSSQPRAYQYHCMLSGGDDYELCFTAPPSRRAAVEAVARQTDTPLTCIGYMTQQPGLRLIDANGKETYLADTSFDHFATP